MIWQGEYKLFNCDPLTFFLLAWLEFYHSLFESFFSNRNPHRNADQIGVIELDPGAFVAVIQENTDPGGLQRIVNFFRLRAGVDLFAGAQWAKYTGNEDGPDSSGFKAYVGTKLTF